MTDDGVPEAEQRAEDADPLARFRNWHGFLAAAIVLNVLFVWGLWHSAADPATRAWTKALSWLPFNAIATLLYYAIKVKLANRAGGGVLGVLCLVMILANWIVMFIA